MNDVPYKVMLKFWPLVSRNMTLFRKRVANGVTMRVYLSRGDPQSDMNGIFTKEGKLGHAHQMKAKPTTQGMPKITNTPPEAGGEAWNRSVLLPSPRKEPTL